MDHPNVCMYNFYWLLVGLQVFLKGSLLLHTLYFYRCHLHQPFSTGSYSTLGAEASRVSPGISIGRTVIVVIRTPYIWSYVSVLALTVRLRSRESNPRTCSQSHHTKALALSFWTYSFRWVPNHQGPEKLLEKIHWCWPGFEPEPPDYQSDTLPTAPLSLFRYYYYAKKVFLTSLT